MQFSFNNLLKENYYKSLSTISIAVGFSFCSFMGLYVKDIAFQEDLSGTNLYLCLALLIVGIMFLGLSIYFNIKIDLTKGVKRK